MKESVVNRQISLRERETDFGYRSPFFKDKDYCPRLRSTLRFLSKHKKRCLSQLCTLFVLKPEIGRDYPLNLSI